MPTHTPAPGWLCLHSKGEVCCCLYQWSLICIHGSWKCPPCWEEAVTSQWFITKTNLLPDGGIHRVLPDKGSSASVVGSSKCPCPEGLVGWGEAVAASYKPTHSALVRKGKVKENARRDGTKAIWPCCWLYFYPGRTAFSPKELFSSANKNRIWLLPIWLPQLQAEALGLVWVPFNPYRYMVTSSQGWVRWAFQECYHGFWFCSVMEGQNPSPDSEYKGFWK